MSHGLEPTEEYDGSIAVHLLNDRSGREEIRCVSYQEAIAVVKANHRSVTVAKIVDRAGDVVFTSAEMAIDDWETEWERAKRRLSVDVEEYDCPHDNIACFADDLCIDCQIDRVKEQY
ncbi:hypothetical protein [Natrinema sp. DC36]|uniref:hypothetical protein n=1 Tax=Natrinema sp. DC36 TaxID=2878680 RepID=UPI001CF0250D|nr:hypothetical protein [Natrinema sp. DC36]